MGIEPILAKMAQAVNKLSIAQSKPIFLSFFQGLASSLGLLMFDFSFGILAFGVWG